MLTSLLPHESGPEQTHAISMVGLLSCFCLLGFIHLSLSRGYTVPRCCTSDRWSAFLGPTELRPDGDSTKLKISSRFFYDFANKRWALYQIHPENQTEAVRLVADYKKGLKYLIRNKEDCTSAVLKAKMYRYCIPENATYLGTYRYGEHDGSGSEFDTWSYDLKFFALRNYLKVTTPDCVPMQESMTGIVRNTFGWVEGDPPCIPWEMPSQVKTGDCYRCHMKLDRRRSSTMPIFSMNSVFGDQYLWVRMYQSMATSILADNHSAGCPCLSKSQTFLNFKYVDIEKGVPTPESDIFGIPTGCKQVKTWGSDIKLSRIQRHFLMRFTAH